MIFVTEYTIDYQGKGGRKGKTIKHRSYAEGRENNEERSLSEKRNFLLLHFARASLAS